MTMRMRRAFRVSAKGVQRFLEVSARGSSWVETMGLVRA